METRPQPPLFNVKIADGSNGVLGYEPLGSSSPPLLQQGVASSSNDPSDSGTGTGGSMKKKRGRPRKYDPDGKPILAATPVSTSPASAAPPSTGAYYFAANVGATSAAESAKKGRGRPPGSTRKRQIEALGSAGFGFTPHVVTVNTGEDVSAKILEFSQQSTREICILSANGAISNVSLHQSATSGGTVTYEGRYEILSLSGSFQLSASGRQRSRIGRLCVSLAGPDGQVLGGGVAGLLIAASPVQDDLPKIKVIVGTWEIILSSFAADVKMESESISASGIAPGSGNLGMPGNAMGTNNPLTGSC